MRALLWGCTGLAWGLTVVHASSRFALVSAGLVLLCLLWEGYGRECAQRERDAADAKTLALARVKSPALEKMEALEAQVGELQSQVTALRLNRGMQ